jgi:hypothetical protein
MKNLKDDDSINEENIIFQEDENNEKAHSIQSEDDSYLYRNLSEMSLDIENPQVELKKILKIKSSPLVTFIMCTSAMPTILGVVVVALLCNMFNTYNNTLSVQMIKSSNEK